MMKGYLLITLSFVYFSLAAQSPWPRSKAGFFVQAAWQTIPAYKQIFETLNTPNVLFDRELTEHTFQLYGEYGLNPQTTIVGSLPIRFLKNGEFIPYNFDVPQTPEGTLTGLGNSTLAIRRAIYESDLRLTGTLRLDFPSNSYDDITGLRAGYNAWNLEPTISIGMGLRKIYWFAYGGYGLRSGGYSHYLSAGGELGVKLGRFYLAGFTEAIYSLQNGDVALPLRNQLKNLYVDNQSWLSFGAKTIFEANRFWGFTASYAGASWGQFVPESSAISLGIYCKWD